MSKGEAWALLEHAPGRFGLLLGPGSLSAARLLATEIGSSPTNVSELLTIEDPDGWRSPELTLIGHRVLVDLDVLFWPAVPTDPLRLLGTLVRRRPLIAVWPGTIVDRRASYSRPGRPDHYDESLPKGAIVLRSRPITFLDEVPYEVERV